MEDFRLTAAERRFDCRIKEHPSRASRRTDALSPASIARKSNSFSKFAVIPFDGGEPVKVFDRSPTTFVEAGIRWTPDGRALSFIDNRDGVSNVWLQPLDGSPAKQLTNFTSETIFRFAWSPDGKMFVAERGTETGDIVLINK